MFGNPKIIDYKFHFKCCRMKWKFWKLWHVDPWLLKMKTVKMWNILAAFGLFALNLVSMLIHIDYMFCPWKPLVSGGLVSDQWRRRVKVSISSGCFCVCHYKFVPMRGLITQHQLALTSVPERGGEKPKSYRRMDWCHEQGECRACIFTPTIIKYSKWILQTQLYWMNGHCVNSTERV